MNLNKSKIFLILSLSFLSGIFCRSFYEPDVFWIWIFATAGIAVFVSNHKNIKAVVFSLAAVFFLAGIWRTDSALEKTQNIPDFDGEIADTAYIIKEPEDKEWYKNVVVKTKDDRKILVRAGLFEELNYGDEINLSCDPEIPQNFSQDFDYRMYLAKDGIFYVCQKAEIEKTGKRMNNIYSFVLELKKKMEKNVDRAIPAPQSALAKGLLFGGDEGLSKDLQESFSKTGMTHIVAVSGYNVTIIAEYLMLSGIFLGMWRKQAFYFALFGIFLFVAMIGFPSSAIRAGLMGSLLLWAMKNGRLANIDNAILLAGAIMLWINPLSLRWDIGFQLSFLATFGIVKMAPLWERYFFWKNKALGIVDIALMTISAQIFVFPIIMYNFHTLSVVSILANILILLIIPITMLFAFLSALSGFIAYPLSLAFGWAGYWLLRYEIGVVEILADFDWSSMEINNFGASGVIIWYIFLSVLIFFISKLDKKEVFA